MVRRLKVAQKSRGIGKWNTLKVKCVGKYPHIITWLNGQKICEFDGASFKHPTYDSEKVWNALVRNGSIAVQGYGGGGWPKGTKVCWKIFLSANLEGKINF